MTLHHNGNLWCNLNKFYTIIFLWVYMKNEMHVFTNDFSFIFSIYDLLIFFIKKKNTGKVIKLNIFSNYFSFQLEMK